MEQVKIEKIAETFKDEEFAKRIIKIKGKEELIKAFAEKGLELSVEEVNELIQKGKEAISNDEFSKIKKALSEDELENIAGGNVWNNLGDFALGTTYPWLAAIAIGTNPKDPSLSVRAGYFIIHCGINCPCCTNGLQGIKSSGKGYLQSRFKSL